MKFKLDENLPAELAEVLRGMGHAADTVEDEGLSGAPDLQILTAAEEEGRVLLTLDKGIANQLRHPGTAHKGVVLFRPRSVGRGVVLAFVKQHLAAFMALPIQNRITVVTENGIRIR